MGWVEPGVHWLTEVTRPEAVASRRTINAWYEDFPEDDGRFAARLLSEDDASHYQAVDELHIHHLLRQRHDDVRYEVGGVGPDFRVFVADECVAGVEVLSLFQQQEWTDEEMRHARLADAVCVALAPTHGYFVDFQIEHADRDPAPRRYIAHLQRELDALPPHEDLVERLAKTGDREVPAAIFEDDGVIISTRFVPMRRDAPVKTDPDARIVGTGGVIGGMVNTAERLRDRVSAKAGSRYDIADASFLVAVGLHDVASDDLEIVNGLYGSHAIEVRTHETVRQDDGVFGIDPQRGAGVIGASRPSRS